METPQPPKPGGESLSEQIGRSLQQQRDRVSEFVASQRRRVDSVEARLSERINALLDHLDKDRRDAEATSRQIEQQSQHTSREKETLEQLRKTLDDQQQQWQTAQQQTQHQQEQLIERAHSQGEELQERLQRLLDREPEIQAAEQKLRDEEHGLELARREHEVQCRESVALKEALETERAELQSRHDRLDTEQSEMQDKRRRIAHTLKQQRSEQFEEINRQREDLARRESVQLEDFRAQIAATTGSDGEATLQSIQQQSEYVAEERRTLERLKETLDEQQQQLRTIQKEIREQQVQFLEQLQGRRDELDARSQQLDQREPEIQAHDERLRQERQAIELARQTQEAELQQIETLKEQLQVDQAELQCRADATASERGPADELRAELEAAKRREAELAAQIEELKIAAKSRPSDANEGDSSEGDEELRRRHEMAIEDLKELRAANAELQQRLSDARAGNQKTTAAAPGGTLDWEAEKQRILDALEDEDGDGDEQRPTDHLEIEGVIQMTDKALAEKDRDIADLKLLLENQSDNIGSMAVGATALGETLDSDPLIQEERKNLERLQETWQKKLSEAEIEISTERAKLARERLAIEEKVRLLEESLSQQSGQPQEDEAADQPTQHRWLTRLGLSNDSPDDEK